MFYFLAIKKNINGCCETIKFKSKTFLLSKKVEFFCKSPCWEKMSPECCSNGETMGINKNRGKVIPAKNETPIFLQRGPGRLFSSKEKII